MMRRARASRSFFRVSGESRESRCKSALFVKTEAVKDAYLRIKRGGSKARMHIRRSRLRCRKLPFRDRLVAAHDSEQDIKR
jgi:hypothetical protein